MSKYPAMSVHVTPDRTRHIVWVSVFHDPNQNHTRAVDPRAKKEFKDWVSKNIMFGEMMLESVTYGQAIVLDRVVSRYKFTY